MTIIAPLPNIIHNGDPIDATPVMADFNQIVSNVNANAADLNAQNTFSQPQNGVAAILGAQLTTLAQVQALFNSFIPIGGMLDYAATSVPAGSSWLLCDGSAVSRTTYALLFAKIGTIWGAGDGVTTFNVPDMRRKVTIGSGGTGSAIISNTTGSIGGAETHGIAVAELPAHNHGISDPGHVHVLNDPTHNHGISDPGHAHTINDPGHNHQYTGKNSGVAQVGSGWNNAADATLGTVGNTTGISIFAATTGITTVGNPTGITMNTATTGITTQNTGSGTAMTLMQPSAVVTKMIRTGL